MPKKVHLYRKMFFRCDYPYFLVLTTVPYESLDPQIALSLFIIYTILTIFTWILTFFLGFHWYQYKNPPVRYLTLAFMFYASAPSILAVGMYEVVQTGLKMELFIYSLGIPR